jgi:electron transfer flavoprotein alpha/beta subunit
VSAIEGDNALTERAQRQGVWVLTGRPGHQARGREAVSWGPGRSIKIERRGSEGVQGGSDGVRAVRSRSDGGNQTGKDERLRVALKGGPGCQARVHEAVSRGPGRAIKIGRGNQTGETDVREAAPLLSAAVRSPELRQARARVAPGSPELGREGEGTTVNSMAGKRP